MASAQWVTIRAAMAGLLIGTAALGGCAAWPGEIVAGEAKLPDEQSPGYLDRVAAQPTVCENDGMRGILLLVDQDDPAETFQQRVERLQKRRIVSARWDYQAGRPLTKGKLAYMIYQACNVPGGMTLTLFGPSQRYCLRELQFRGMMSSGALYTKITGLEFVAALDRAVTYLDTGQLPHIKSSTLD